MTTEKLNVLVKVSGRVKFFTALALKKLVVLALYTSDLQSIREKNYKKFKISLSFAMPNDNLKK